MQWCGDLSSHEWHSQLSCGKTTCGQAAAWHSIWKSETGRSRTFLRYSLPPILPIHCITLSVALEKSDSVWKVYLWWVFVEGFFERHSVYPCQCILMESYWLLLQCYLIFRFSLMYTGCPRRNVPNFGRVFLRLKYTDITQNTYIQSWTVTEIMAGEVWNFDSCYTLIDYQIHIKTGRNMWFL